VARAWRIVN